MFKLFRQAGAVMMLLIGVNFFNGEAAVGHTIGNIIEPELKPSILAKSIVKLESSENVKGEFPLAEFTCSLGWNARELIAVDRGNGQAHSWRKFASVHDSLLRGNEGGVKRELVDFNVYPICHVFGRSLTTICEPETELRCQSVTPAVSRGFFDRDVGPQLNTRGSYLPISYKYQTAGNKGEKYGRERDYSVMLIADDIAEPDEDGFTPKDYRSMKSGAVFVGGLIIALIVAFVAGRNP
jgi:hypothetical protein